MKRLGRQKVKDERKYPYITSIKFVKPLFWKTCCGCQDEFKKEGMYKIRMQKPTRSQLGPWYDINTFTYYVCKECCSEPGAIKFFLEEKYGQRTFAEWVAPKRSPAPPAMKKRPAGPPPRVIPG